MAFDVDDERFDVGYDPERASPETIAQAVRALGYQPTTVPAGTRAAAARAPVPIEELPAGLRALFAQARDSGKAVLLDFAAPG